MDAVVFQEARKAHKKIGNLSELKTNAKTSAVEAINELKSEIKGSLTSEVIETEVFVDSGETVASWLNFMQRGYIKGIKVTGNEFTGEFYFKLYTKQPDMGGKYVYYSGKIINTLWDVPENDIPFFDETGQHLIYYVLENKGVPTNFKIQIFVLKG